MKSKMFLNDVTVIDAAYIDDEGRIIGDSVRPKFAVSGNVDEKEGVVVDFSAIKKNIKNIIDAKYSGFDHKLWLIEGYSNYTLADEKTYPANIKVNTPYVTIDAPKSAFKFIQSTGVPGDYIGDIMRQLVDELTAELELLYPTVNLEIDLWFGDDFMDNPAMDTSLVPFRYTHGLKNSTSWGCQNIAHGHLSYLAASTTDDANNRAVEMLLHEIASELDKSIFVWGENVTALSPDSVTVEYTSDRGTFKMVVEGSYAATHMLILPTETTVEFLADAIATQYRDLLTAVGVVDLYVSEGLTKGAVVNIQGE